MSTIIKELKKNVSDYIGIAARTDIIYWSAISEFIDNSVSSYRGKDKNNFPIRSCDGLNVDITFDDTNEDNIKLQIIDNASGMDSNTLYESILQGYIDEKKGPNSYNQHGWGLKLGAFHFGKDLRIWTKDKNTCSYLELLCFGKEPSDVIDVTIEDNNKDNKIKTETGTFIEISHIYPDRNTIEGRGYIENLKEALSFRFKKLINQGLRIKINLVTNCEKIKEKTFTIEAKNFKPFKRSEFLQMNLTKNAKNMLDSFENELINKKNVLLNHDPKNQLISLVDKYFNDEEFEFEKVIPIEDKNIKIHYGIFSIFTDKKFKYSYNQIQGLTTYHLDRAINHPPNVADVNNGNLIFKSSGKDPKNRRLYGYADLTGIYDPEQNKKDFQWSLNHKEIFIEELSKIYKELFVIVEIVANVTQNNSDNKISKETQVKEYASGIENKEVFKSAVEDVRVTSYDKNKFQCEFKLKSSGIVCKIREVTDENIFIKSCRDDETNDLIIKVNINHSFWKPLLNTEHEKAISDEFKKNILYPLCTILAIANDTYENRELSVDIKNSEGSFMNIIDDTMKQLQNIKIDDEK